MLNCHRPLIVSLLVAIWWISAYNQFASAISTNLPKQSLNIGKQTKIVCRSSYYEEIAIDALSRRSMIVFISSLSSLVPDVAKSLGEGQKATSVDNSDKDSIQRPFAPTAALLPATRLKVVVDKMYSLSNSLSTTLRASSIGKEQLQIEKQYIILEEMNEIWTNRPQLFQATTDGKKLSSSSNGSTLAQLTTSISSANKQQYRENRKDITNVPDKVAAIFNQADVERQWGILKYQEMKLERQNELRAALNYYTSQLIFSSSSYTLTASAEKRKEMIRNDQLPTTTTVVTSDLDLRDLYRNDFLTRIEDAVAEIKYQLKQKSSVNQIISTTFDVSDVIDLMDQAHTALSKWFDLISPKDVQEAMEIIAPDI